MPITDRQPGKIRCAESRRFRDSWSPDRHAQQVSLKLHKKIIRDHAPIRPELIQHDARIGLHRSHMLRQLRPVALRVAARARKTKLFIHK